MSIFCLLIIGKEVKKIKIKEHKLQKKAKKIISKQVMKISKKNKGGKEE